MGGSADDLITKRIQASLTKLKHATLNQLATGKVQLTTASQSPKDESEDDESTYSCSTSRPAPVPTGDADWASLHPEVAIVNPGTSTSRRRVAVSDIYCWQPQDLPSFFDPQGASYEYFQYYYGVWLGSVRLNHDARFPDDQGPSLVDLPYNGAWNAERAVTVIRGSAAVANCLVTLGKQRYSKRYLPFLDDAITTALTQGYFLSHAEERHAWEVASVNRIEYLQAYWERWFSGKEDGPDFGLRPQPIPLNPSEEERPWLLESYEFLLEHIPADVLDWGENYDQIDLPRYTTPTIQAAITAAWHQQARHLSYWTLVDFIENQELWRPLLLDLVEPFTDRQGLTNEETVAVTGELPMATPVEAAKKRQLTFEQLVAKRLRKKLKGMQERW